MAMDWIASVPNFLVEVLTPNVMLFDGAYWRPLGLDEVKCPFKKGHQGVCMHS